MARRHLDFRCLASITVRQHISAVLSHQFMALSQGSSRKLRHPPVASYLIQKENQCIITTWSRPPLTWLTSAPTAPCLNNPLNHTSLFNGPQTHCHPPTMRPQCWGRLVLSQTFADAIPSAGRVLSSGICKAVPPIFLQGSAQAPL